MNKFLGVLVITLSPLLTSCSLFVEGKQRVSIMTSDPDAMIHVDGKYLGKGQGVALLKKNEYHSATATKGNLFASFQIDYQISTTGLLDGIGAGLFAIPALGFISAGAWELETTDVYLVLE